MVADGNVVLVCFLGDGHPGPPFGVLVGAKAVGGADVFLLRGAGNPLRCFKGHEECGVGEDGASSGAVDVQGVFVNRLGAKRPGQGGAAELGVDVAFVIQAGERGLGVPDLAVVEFDPLAELEPPGIGVDQFPAFRAAGGNDAEVIARLPGEGILHGQGHALEQTGPGAAPGVEADGLVGNHQGNAVPGGRDAAGQRRIGRSRGKCSRRRRSIGRLLNARLAWRGRGRCRCSRRFRAATTGDDQHGQQGCNAEYSSAIETTNSCSHIYSPTTRVEKDRNSSQRSCQ